MTSLEMSKLIGQGGYLSASGMTFGVVVLDARSRYGKVDILVKPKEGSGTKWVERARVVLNSLPR